jgi:hypothetical protein
MQPMAAILILGFYVFQSVLRRILEKKKAQEVFFVLPHRSSAGRSLAILGTRGKKKKKKDLK